METVPTKQLFTKFPSIFLGLISGAAPRLLFLSFAGLAAFVAAFLGGFWVFRERPLKVSIRLRDPTLGVTLKENVPFAQVEDNSRLVLPIRVPGAQVKDIPLQSKVVVSHKAEESIELIGEVRYASARSEAPGSDVAMEVCQRVVFRLRGSTKRCT